MEFIVYTVTLVVSLTVTYFTGKYIENRHYNSIKKREANMRSVLVFNERCAPHDLVSGKFHLVCGSVVISGSYFKQVVTTLKSIFGGRLNSLESVMDIGRREAILRMKEQASIVGADIIFNVRFETTTLEQSTGNGGIFCAEFFAYGTAWKKR
ncbi:MAG: YbjQ family protein [Campylobacteraceae bacterium]|jgi:uncharacterized protein YbjQ (UPF0145 family)|nr:YbjQ family protein [Campylobacteraceae bacterium]